MVPGTRLKSPNIRLFLSKSSEKVEWHVRPKAQDFHFQAYVIQPGAAHGVSHASWNPWIHIEVTMSLVLSSKTS